MIRPTSATWTSVRAVFFDIGGTLAYPHPSFNGLIAQTCQQHGLAVTEEDACHVEPAVWQHIGRRADAGRGFSLTDEDSQRFWLWVYRTYLTELGHAAAAETELPRILWQTFVRSESYRLYDDVVPTLDRLRRAGYILGVISNWEAWLERLLIDLSIRDYFHVTVVSGRAGIEKPHPEIFRLALEGAGVDPEEAVHVGDNPNDDVAGAEAVGIRGVLLDRSDRFAPVLPTNRSGGEASGRRSSNGPADSSARIPLRVRHLLELPEILGAP